MGRVAIAVAVPLLVLGLSMPTSTQETATCVMVTPFSDESGSEAEAAIARRIAFQLKRLDLVCPWQGLEKGEALGEAHGAWRDSTASFSEVNRFDVKVRGFEHEEGYYDVIAILSGRSEFSVSGTDQRLDLPLGPSVVHWVRNYQRDDFSRFASTVVDRVLEQVETWER